MTLKYYVIHPFLDSQDKTNKFKDGRPYQKGEPFPATKREVSEMRLEQLSSDENALKRPVIQAIPEEITVDEQKSGE